MCSRGYFSISIVLLFTIFAFSTTVRAANTSVGTVNSTVTINQNVTNINDPGYDGIPNFSFSLKTQYIVKSGEVMWVWLDAKNEGYASDEFIFNCYFPFNSTQIENLTWSKRIMIGEEYSTMIQMPVSLFLKDNNVYNINCEIRQANNVSQEITNFPLTVSAPFYVQPIQRTAINQIQDTLSIAEKQVGNLPIWLLNPVLMLVTYLVRSRIDKIRNKKGKKAHPYMSFALLVITVFFFFNGIYMALLG